MGCHTIGRTCNNGSGTLSIPGVGTYNSIASSTANWSADDHVVVNATIPTSAVGATYTLVDDDAVTLPRLPNLELMEEKLAPAFVRPLEVTGSFNGNSVADQNAGFCLNISPGELKVACDSVRDLPCVNAFWAVQVLGAYQGPTPNGTDGANEGWEGGGTPEQDGKCFSQSGIYLEVCDELALELPVVVHEVGHAFQLPETPGTIMDGSNLNRWRVFSPQHLDSIRRIDRPGH